MKPNKIMAVLFFICHILRHAAPELTEVQQLNNGSWCVGNLSEPKKLKIRNTANRA